MIEGGMAACQEDPSDRMNLSYNSREVFDRTEKDWQTFKDMHSSSKWRGRPNVLHEGLSQPPL